MNLGQKAYNLIENFLRSLVAWFCKLLSRELNEDKFQALMQFVRFGIVGVSNTLISYVIYTVSLLIFQRAGIFSKVDYVIAQVMAFLLGTLWAFYWNSKKVFVKQEDEERSLLRSMLKTYASYAFSGLFLSSVLLVFWIDYCGISEFVAPLINLTITVPLNFLINKFWAFKTKKK